MSRKILVIDDEEIIRSLLTDILEDKGYQVITAADGETGLKQAQDDQPDLIIVDLLIPKMPGGVVAKKLRENEKTARIPIVFLTGMLDKGEADITDHQFAGEHLLAKPIDQNELFATIEKAINKE